MNLIPIKLAALLLVIAYPTAGAAAPTETVRFDSDSVTIVGMLALPDPKLPRRPAIVLLHGSEPGRRDSPFFRPLRDRLTAAGWVVLTYDRRGVGESGGHYSEMPDLREPAGDAVAAVGFLAAREDIDPGRIGLLGVSQGGWAAPLAATLEPRVSFVIAVSAPGVSPLEQSSDHRAAEAMEAGLGRAAADSATALRLMLYRYWHGDVPRAGVDSAWAVARGSSWLERPAQGDDLFSRIGHLPSVPPPSKMPPDFMRSLETNAFYDPIPVAERVKVPVLHVYGAADRHILVAKSVDALRAAYARAGNSDVTFRVLPHAGHGMQAVRGDAECLRCPMNSKEPWKPAAGWLDTVMIWLKAHDPRGRIKP